MAVGLLLAEYLLVSVRFDSLTVVERGGLWTLAGRIGVVAPLGAVVVTALLLRKREQRVTEPLDSRLNYWLLGVHGVSFAGLFALTAKVFGGVAAPQGPAALWLGLWLLTAAGTAFSLLAAMVSRETLSRVLSWSLLLAAVTGVLAWAAGLFSTELWSVVADLTLRVVVAMLRPFFSTVGYNATESQLSLGDFSVVVSAVCSGLEGVGLIAVLLVAFLVTFRDRLRFPNALLLLPIGIASVWLGNALRIACLMVVGATVDADLALGGFHSKLGWIFFCAVALGIAAIAQRTKFFSREVTNEGPTENPTAAYLMPVLALLATALVTAMLVRDFDRYYWLRLVAAGVMLYAFRGYYRDLARELHALPTAVGVLAGILWLVTASGEESTTSAKPDVTWLAVRTFGSVLVVPLVEELAFRGCLLRWLISRDFTSVPFTKWTPWAVLGSSVAFGLLHERWLAATFAGVIYAAIQLRRGRLADAVIAHAATNATISAWVLWTGNLTLWS